MHRGQDFNEAPVCSAAGSRNSMRHQSARAQGPHFQLGPSVLVHRNHDFNEAKLRLHIGAMRSMRPQCAHAGGPGVQ